MASTQEPTSPGNNYSTLEAVQVSQSGYLSLESTYLNADETMEAKETWHEVEEVSNEKATGIRGFMSRRFGGRSMRTILIIVALLLAAIVAAIVAGVITTRPKRNNARAPDSTPTTTSSFSNTAIAPTSTPTVMPPVTKIPDWLYFSPENWYTFNNNHEGEHYWRQASYDKGTDSGSLRSSDTYSDDADQAMAHLQFQIRGVPGTWENSTVAPTGMSMTRTYWISCRSSGPDVKLALVNSEWEAVDTWGSRHLHFHPMKTNHGEEGQYWYFEPIEGTAGERRYKLYNTKAGLNYSAAFVKDWANPMLTEMGNYAGKAYEWMVKPRSRIDKHDGAFESEWQIDPGPEVDKPEGP